jgi:ADP-heptose:LPS heptosyltransferase
MIEITKIINKARVLTIVTNSVFRFIFYIIRRVVKLLTGHLENIVVISLHKLGDSVLTIPAIREIQNLYRKEIVIFCFAEAIPIYKVALENVKFHSTNKNNFYFGNRICNHKTRRELARLKPKIIFDITGFMTSATLIFNSRAKQIIGMNRPHFSTIYDNYIPINRRPHLMDMYLDIIDSVTPNKIDRSKIKAFPKSEKKDGSALVHFTAGWKAKEWNKKKYFNLVLKLAEEIRITVISNKNELPIDLKTELNLENINLITTDSIDELINQIQSCSYFIGNDSGPLHIADLLGKPTFSIYGPTNPKYPMPIGNHHSYIEKKIECSTLSIQELCFTNGGRVGCSSYECMNLLSVKQVKDKLVRHLNR